MRSLATSLARLRSLPPLATSRRVRPLNCAVTEPPPPPEEEDHAEFRRGLQLFEAGKVGEATDAFAAAAQAGSAGGNYFLALGYDGLLGENAAGEPWVEPNPARAFRCYERAARCARHCVCAPHARPFNHSHMSSRGPVQ